MILRSFKSVGWVAGVGAAALGCYMLSLQVAAERAELASVDSRIVAAQRAIRDLQTELGTRGRLQQLEHWNAEVLALSAPAAGQFVENELVLARFETRGAGENGIEAPVRMASAEAAPPPAQRAEAPRAAARPAIAPAPAERPSAQPVVRRASLAATTPVPTAAPAARRSAAAPARTAAAPARTADTRPVRVAAREPAPVRTALLDERLTRELNAAARAERRRASAASAGNRQGGAQD